VTPGEVVRPSIVVAGLAPPSLARPLFVRHKLGEHGNRAMLRPVNSLRERRGF
jgi:hypothetical protein